MYGFALIVYWFPNAKHFGCGCGCVVISPFCVLLYSFSSICFALCFIAFYGFVLFCFVFSVLFVLHFKLRLR